jgi:hypothetical protein
MAKPKHPPGEPMTLGNMRHLGVHRLIASCHQDACQGLIDVSKYPDDTPVPSFASKVVPADKAEPVVLNLVNPLRARRHRLRVRRQARRDKAGRVSPRGGRTRTPQHGLAIAVEWRYAKAASGIRPSIG